jgi:hypothetical protein
VTAKPRRIIASHGFTGDRGTSRPGLGVALLLMLATLGALASSPSAYVAVPLLSYAAYACALVLVPRFVTARPPRVGIWAGGVVSALAAGIWLISGVATIRYAWSPWEAYVLGGGGFRVEWHSTRKGSFARTPALTLSWGPTTIASGLSYVETTYHSGGSSGAMGCPIWGFVAAFSCPTLVLRKLRHDRAPAGSCGTCGYDLTGNVSGRCPECGHPCNEEQVP